MQSMPTKVIRFLVGALLLLGGVGKFVPILEQPPHNEAGAAFLTALVATGYMMPVIGLVEILAGLAFVTGRYVAAAAVILAPVALNIVLFHAVLDPSGAGPGFFVGAANVWLLVVSLPKYRDMLDAG